MLRLSVWGGGIPAVIGLALIPQVPATAAQPQRRTTTLSATGHQMLRVAEEFARRGQRDKAEQVLELLSADPDSDVRNEARFKLAAMASAAGNYSKSAVLLRRILDEKPTAAPVRLELAAVLTKMGDQDSALRQLRFLRSGNLPPNVARFVDRLSASLQASKPLGFHLELALAPDTNVNRATQSDTLGTVFGDFIIDEKARSGVGVTARGLAQARLPISDRFHLVTRAASDISIYRDSDFNDILIDVAAGPEIRFGQFRTTAEVGASQQWYGMKSYQRTVRLAGSIARPVGPVSQVRLDLAGRLTDNKFNDLQDGRGIGARVRLERALSPQLLLSASAGADRFKAKDDAYSTRTWNLGLTAYRDIGRMTMSAGVEFGWLNADERLALLPQAREDRLIRVQFGAVFRHLSIAGLSPMARLVIERNRSSVEFYDFKRTRAEVGVSRAF